MHIVRKVFLWLLVAFWIVAGIGHFRNPDFYLRMMPQYLPLHYELVILSGVTEILCGVMVAIPKTRRLGAWFIFAHLAVFMLVHVDMLVYAQERFPEVPIWGLWLRLPMQGVLALWAWWVCFDKE